MHAISKLVKLLLYGVFCVLVCFVYVFLVCCICLLSFCLLPLLNNKTKKDYEYIRKKQERSS